MSGLTARGGTLTVKGGSSPALGPGPDLTYFFNDAEDYPLGKTAAGSGLTADGSSRFDYFNLGGTGVNEISTAHPISGTKSFHHTSTATAASSYNGWITNVAHATPEYISAQFMVPTQFSGQMVVMNLRTTAAGAMAGVMLDPTGSRIRLIAADGTTAGIMTATYPVNADFRLELAVVVQSPTAGRAIVRYFADPAGTTPTETLDVASINTGSAAVGRANFGLYNQLANNALYVKNQRKSNAGWPPAPGGAFSIADNGNGTLTVSGVGVTDNGDGTVTLTGPGVTSNSDGTVTLVS